MKPRFKILIVTLLLIFGILGIAKSNFGKKTYPALVGKDLMASSFAQAAIKGEKYFLVNNKALVLKIDGQPGDLPVILMDSVEDIEVGEKFDQKEVISTIKILGDLEARKLHPTMTKIISSQQVNIWLNNGALVVISFQKEAGPQLDSLQVILSRVKMEGKTLREIDLRFNKPVILYE